MSSSRSPDSKPPADDLRALLDKATVGNRSYRTFAPQKSAQVLDREKVPVTVSESAALAQPAVHNNARRALHSIFEVNSRLRIDSSRPRLAPGSGVAVAFASCAGGVGKTTLCATIARSLSSRLANVLLADRCADSIIPYYFSLERQGAGGLQTVYPNARRAGYQMTLVVAPSTDPPQPATVAWLEQLQAESVLTLLDLPTFHGTSGRGALHGASQIVVPLVPDVQSLASIAQVEALSRSTDENSGHTHFVLNRFDEAKPLHREIRTHLEKLLEGRLAPVALRESEYVPEALSLGMTVLDHAPQSPVTRDFEQFAEWMEKHLTLGAGSSTEKAEIA